MFYALFVGFMVCTMLYAAFYALFKSVLLSKCLAFSFKYCHSCTLVGLFLDAYTWCIMHWLSVGHASDLHWVYWLVCPDVHSKCEWALWSLFYSDCLFGQAMVCFLTPSLLDLIMPASYAFHAFLHTMIMMYCCVLGDSCSYDSRVSQLLELGVSEFCSIVPSSHVKSRVYFRVLLRNSQRGRL